jgi:tRNA G18 (ribose-2'-O)-methylase SpoU
VSATTSIDDPDDPRVAEYRALNDAALRRSIERDEVCIAEGALVVDRLLHSPFSVRSFLVSDRRWPALGRLAGAIETHDAPAYLATQAVMNEIAGFDIHRGVLASATRPNPPTARDVLEAAALVAVLEGINDHENVGVIFRNADALGIDAVLLDPTCCDPLYRRAIRVSMGAAFVVPFARLATLDDVAGFTLVALTPSGEHELADVDADRVAVLLGAEGPGLSEQTLAASDLRVRIAMRPGVDSLGVASASAIAFHQFGRGHLGRPRGSRR